MTEVGFLAEVAWAEEHVHVDSEAERETKDFTTKPSHASQTKIHI